MKIVEEDDVMIDDISCVILEFINNDGSAKSSPRIDFQAGISSLGRVQTVLSESAQLTVTEDNNMS